MDAEHPSGGSTALGQLIDDFGEFIAADLKEVYDVDLRDVLVPGSGVTPRWVLVLVRGLPIGSRFYAERRGGQQFRGWDETQYIRAETVNTLRAVQYVITAANSEKKPKLPKPFPVPELSRGQRADKPGSFAFIAKAKLAAAKSRKAEA